MIVLRTIADHLLTIGYEIVSVATLVKGQLLAECGPTKLDGSWPIESLTIRRKSSIVNGDLIVVRLIGQIIVFGYCVGLNRIQIDLNDPCSIERLESELRLLTDWDLTGQSGL